MSIDAAAAAATLLCRRRRRRMWQKHRIKSGASVLCRRLYSASPTGKAEGNLTEAS